MSGPVASGDDADVNPPRPAFDDDQKAMSWLQEETPFACEGLGDLVTLEKSKLRDDIRSLGTACSDASKSKPKSRVLPK